MKYTLTLIAFLFALPLAFGQDFGSQQVITLSADYAYSVYATDLDGDGDADVLSASQWDNKIAWYENLGGGSFGSQQVITLSADEASFVYATDIDGDGDADVLSASRDDDKIAWYENLGGGSFGSQQVITLSAVGARSVYATDLDGDGDADVLSASWDDDKIAWYENLGGGSFGSQQVISLNADYAESVYATDLDGDGDADVLSASRYDGKIAWYENLGGGSFGSQQVITTSATAARSVYATDLDGDGDADVLSASALDDKIAWYENGMSNDDCVYATPIAGDGVFPVDNTDGTGLDADPGCAAFGSDVWYRWTAAATGTVTMDMCDGAATYDSALAAWEDAVGCPSTLIVCNDDTCVLQSEVTFACTTGTVYMIQVGGFNGASGTGNLNVATDPPCIDGTYCTSLPNSTGATAAITWTGSCVVADNNFTLVVRSCPISQPGLFIYGANQASIPFGNGVLCLGQPILRLNPPVFVDSTGLASKSVDLANPPSASGTITAGSTWNFQMWLRDPNAGGAAYNFTDGMSVTFQ